MTNEESSDDIQPKFDVDGVTVLKERKNKVDYRNSLGLTPQEIEDLEETTLETDHRDESNPRLRSQIILEK